MKINNSINQKIDVVTDKPGAKPGKKTEQTSSTATASDNVTISSLSSQLQSLEAKVAKAEVFDVEKVNEIKSAISSGQFKVDADKVADGLISSVKDFLSTQK